MKTLFELDDGDCRFPFGYAAPYLFCDDPVQEESSYCSGHHKICMPPPHALQGREATPAEVSRMRRRDLPAVLVLRDEVEA